MHTNLARYSSLPFSAAEIGVLQNGARKKMAGDFFGFQISIKLIFFSARRKNISLLLTRLCLLCQFKSNTEYLKYMPCT